ncbi:hypothetical protein [Paraburkholderia sp. BR14374]|uniref:hypothetical protein n=1 Tax=Paraburkholderia sp. BR14374 TaxID=3237007 RepID=UPI0034CFB307
MALVTSLPNISNIVSEGDDLRQDTADAITAVEIVAAYGAGGKASAGQLRDFFIAAANAAHKATGDKNFTVGMVPVSGS